MRKLFSLIIVMIAFVAIAGAKANFKSPDSDSCYIYIYRSGKFGGSLENFFIWVDNIKLCELSNGRYFKVGVKPGKHLISAKLSGVGIAKKQTEIPIDCEAAKPIFISCTVKSSALRPRLSLEEEAQDTSQNQISSMKVDDCQRSVED